MAEKKESIPFEEAMGKLEEIVRKLEEGADSLENSLSLFEEGVALARLCNETLDKAEKKLEVLMRKEDKGVTREVDEKTFFPSLKGEEEV